MEALSKLGADLDRAIAAINEAYGYLIHNERDKALVLLETTLDLAGIDPGTGYPREPLAP